MNNLAVRAQLHMLVNWRKGTRGGGVHSPILSMADHANNSVRGYTLSREAQWWLCVLSWDLMLPILAM